MLVDRMSYVVFFKGKKILHKLNQLPVEVVYVSKKQRYAVFYTDKENEESIRKTLKKVSGYKGFSQSQTFDENLNFDVK